MSRSRTWYSSVESGPPTEYSDQEPVSDRGTSARAWPWPARNSVVPRGSRVMSR